MISEGQIARKVYYTIGEVAEMFDVRTSVIRFWEKEFDILRPAKSSSGRRMFTAEDVENIKVIYHLVRERGMTLEGARRRMKGNRSGVRKDMEVMERLQTIRSLLVEIREELKGGGVVVGEIVEETPLPEAPFSAQSLFGAAEEAPVDESLVGVTRAAENVEAFLSAFAQEAEVEAEKEIAAEHAQVAESKPEPAVAPRIVEQTLF